MIATTEKITAFESCDVTLWGYGFSAGAKVEINDGLKNSTLNVVDVDEEKIVFMAPACGSYQLKILNGTDSLEGLELSVVSRSCIPVNKLPSRNLNDFALMLKGLLPRGFAWNFKWTNGSYKTNWQKLLESVAAGIKVAFDDISKMLVELSPAVTSDVSRWFDELGLPINGVTLGDYRNKNAEIYRITRSRCGCTVPYFKSVMKIFGIDIEVYEYWKNPEEFGSYDFGSEDPNSFVLIRFHVHEKDVEGATCSGTCNEALGNGNMFFGECVLNSVKPAHVKFIYAYDNGVRYGDIVDSENKAITDDSGKSISYKSYLW